MKKTKKNEQQGMSQASIETIRGQIDTFRIQKISLEEKLSDFKWQRENMQTFIELNIKQLSKQIERLNLNIQALEREIKKAMRAGKKNAPVQLNKQEEKMPEEKEGTQVAEEEEQKSESKDSDEEDSDSGDSDIDEALDADSDEDSDE